jgi:hypothetical protein
MSETEKVGMEPETWFGFNLLAVEQSTIRVPDEYEISNQTILVPGIQPKAKNPAQKPVYLRYLTFSNCRGNKNRNRYKIRITTSYPSES